LSKAVTAMDRKAGFWNGERTSAFNSPVSAKETRINSRRVLPALLVTRAATMPRADGGGGGGSTLGVIVRKNAWLAVGWEASVAGTGTANVPTIAGVPLSRPSAERVNPAGSAPAVTAKVTAPTPPLVVSVWPKAVPAVPSGRVVALITNAAPVPARFMV